MKAIRIFFLLILFCSFAMSADSVAVKKDSVVIVVPIAELGSIAPYGDSLNIIGRMEIIWKDYRSLYDILTNYPGIFIRDLASPGQKSQIVINGIDDKYIAILVDGIPYNDHASTSYNLWNIPVEMIERVEVLTGPGSFQYDGRSSGVAINIVTKNFTNNKAITQLRYSQGVDGYVHTDAMFAQNVFRNLNLSFGLTHYGYGTNKEFSRFRGRFYNSNDDAWLFRTKLRYDVTNYLNVSFVHLFNRSWTGLHGGVDYLNSSSLFDGFLATVQNFDAYEKLSNSQSFLTIAIAPSEDSSGALTLSGYYYDRLRQYRDEENRATANGILKQFDQSGITKGVRIHYFYSTSFNRFSVNYNYYEVGSGSPFIFNAVSVKDQLTFLDIFDVTGYASLAKELSYGAESAIRLMNNFSLFAGYSYNAGPTLADRFLNEKENIEEYAAGARFQSHGLFQGRIAVTRSTVHSMIVYDTIPSIAALTGSSLHLIGTQTFDALTVFGHLKFGNFHLEGTANYLLQPKRIRDNVIVTFYPEATLYGSAYYHGLLAKGSLDLRIGVRGSFSSQQTGMKPYDEFGLWIPSSLLKFGPSGTMDFFAVGKIGDAYVHFIWENLTGNQYLLAPVYPIYDRNIRFGLLWEFLN